MATKVSAVASRVSRATIVWILWLVPEGDKKALEGANRGVKVAAFTTDTTPDALTFCSRAMSSATVARCGIWLWAGMRI